MPRAGSVNQLGPKKSAKAPVAVKPSGAVKSVKVPEVQAVKNLKVGTAWIKANKDIIESIGWSDRHRFIYGLSRVMCKEHLIKLTAVLSPDVVLTGTLTGRPPTKRIIALPDRRGDMLGRPVGRQRLLVEFGIRVLGCFA